MTTIQLTLTGPEAKAQVDGVLTAGMVGVPVTIVYDQAWEGLAKTLVCKGGGKTRKLYNVGTGAVVAPEVLACRRWEDNGLYLGVEGRDAEGELVMPSTFAYCGEILPGAQSTCPESDQPENPVWAQILTQLGDLDQLNTPRRDNLVAAINASIGRSQDGVESIQIAYQTSASAQTIPAGSWSATLPAAQQGVYLWVRITVVLFSGEEKAAYILFRQDGSGGVATVNGVQPDDTGNIALTAAGVGAVPAAGGDVTGELRMNGQPISGLNPPTENTQAASKGYVDTSVRKAAPRNLLDNSDFTNPVAQAGFAGAHGTARYPIDRWYDRYGFGAFTKTNEGITIAYGTNHAYFNQKIENDGLLVGKTLTFAIGLYDGTVRIAKGVYSAESETATTQINMDCSISIIPGGVQIVVANGSVGVKWAALYEGDYTAETLPKYQPKGYGAELAECQRYYIHLGKLWRYADNIVGFGLVAPIVCPVPMRMTPTVIGNTHRIFDTSGWKEVTLNAIANMSGNEYLLKFNVPEGLSAGMTYLYEGAEGLSADL